MFKIAKQMRRDKKDVTGSNFIKDVDGSIKVDGAEAAMRWGRYFDELLNGENDNVLETVEKVEGPINEVTMAEVKQALSAMKSSKAAGPSEVTSEMLKLAGESGLEQLTEVFQKIVETEEYPSEWAESLTIPLYKGKGDALSCGQYRGLRLLEHGMKAWERLLLRWLQSVVKINSHQCGFTSGKSTSDAIFITRQLQEKYCLKKKELYHIFVDLEKAFDKVPRAAIEWALRRQLVPERLVRLVMGLYDNSTSRAKFAGELSETFPIEVGVHQGSTLSPLLFNVVMEEATKSCRVGDPWELLYADDLILTAESKEEVVEMFKRWKEALEMRGMKVNLSKTKLLVTGKEAEIIESGQFPCAVCGQGVGVNSVLCNGCNKWCHKRCSGLRSLNTPNFRCSSCNSQGGTSLPDDSIHLPDGQVEEVKSFCYLGDVLDRGGGAERTVRNRIACAWSKWRELSNLLTNRGIPLRHRAKVYAACIRSVMLYGSETWALTKKLEEVILRSDRRMLRYMAGVSLQDRVASEEILRRCGLGDILKVLKKGRMRWFGHVVRRGEDEPLAKVGMVQAPGRAPRGRPKKTWRKCVEDVMRENEITEADARDRDMWRGVINRLTSSTEGTR